MSSASIQVTGLTELLLKLRSTKEQAPRRVRMVNATWVPRLRMMLIAHSSGSPGPEVRSGAYNAAYDVHLTDGGMGLEASNPSPQSARLEYGFVGQDSLGRHYHQPPFPHFRPTMDEAGPQYVSDIRRAVLFNWW